MNQVLDSLSTLIRILNSQGHNPATSGNYSHRDLQDQKLIWMSRSGVDKSEFQATDFLPLDLESKKLRENQGAKPSDETSVHSAIYSMDSSINCVLHSHHPEMVILGELLKTQNSVGTLGNLELIKAFKGIKTHDAEVAFLSFSNTQDMEQLSQEIKTTWAKQNKLPIVGVILRRHGVYLWGDSVSSAKRSLEAAQSIAKFLLLERGLL